MRCKKEFNQNIDYIRHQNRKFKCIIKEDESKKSSESTKGSTDTAKDKLTCSLCMVKFSRSDCLKRHIDLDRCTAKKIIDKQKENKDNMIELLIEKLDKNEKEIERLIKNEDEIEKLKNTILELELKLKNTINTNNGTINTTNGNTNCNNINNNIIIQFGEEDISKLKLEEISKIMNKGFCAIEESVKQTHFNSRIPEYHNVYISDKKFKHGLVYNGKEFELQNIDNIIDDLISNHTNNIEEYLEQKNIKYNIKK